MSVLQSEAFEAFRAIDCTEEKTSIAAAALRKRDGVASVKGELLVVKWMIGSVSEFRLAVFAKLFTRRNIPYTTRKATNLAWHSTAVSGHGILLAYRQRRIQQHFYRRIIEAEL